MAETSGMIIDLLALEGREEENQSCRAFAIRGSCVVERRQLRRDGHGPRLCRKDITDKKLEDFIRRK